MFYVHEKGIKYKKMIRNERKEYNSVFDKV